MVWPMVCLNPTVSTVIRVTLTFGTCKIGIGVPDSIVMFWLPWRLNRETANFPRSILVISSLGNSIQKVPWNSERHPWFFLHSTIGAVDKITPFICLLGCRRCKESEIDRNLKWRWHWRSNFSMEYIVNVRSLYHTVILSQISHHCVTIFCSVN